MSSYVGKEEEFRLERGMPVFSDVDRTLIKEDSGKEWLAEADIVERGDFPEFIDSFYHEDLGHSNQLLEFLSQNTHLIEYLHDHVDDVEVEERDGISAILEYRCQQDVPNIGSSAGYEPVIREATNGSLHDVVAGRLENGEPVFNGQDEKRERVEEYLEQVGWETPYTAIGDSNGDIGKIRGAAESGGYGIAIGDTVENARERVEDATFYVGDPDPEHYTAGALLNDLTLDEPYRLSPEELAEEYGFSFTGEIETGELADEKDKEELEEFERRLEEL